MSTLGERIKKLRIQKGLKQKDLAKMLNTTNSTISNYETNYSRPDNETLRRLSDIFGVTTDYLLGRTDNIKETDIHVIDQSKIKNVLEKALLDLIPAKIVKVPILGTIRAGEPMYADENIEGYSIVDEKDIEGEECFLLKVKGDSMMNARIMDGDYVFVCKQPDVESGDIAVVAVDGDEATVKRVLKVKDAIILQPENPNYKPMVFDKKQVEQGYVRIIGKVLFVKTYVK